eukprot:Blabericola_migrator_1__13162@NODE_901_length_6140_cov_65_133707_g631_i0_p5_GENE_NODE_901_length_6140_cov_65_133707_g631_i0NODE_901_length_6140_cov_65_133707_g631_i0_p5_ORF_typecomplete_len293_score49_16Claudin_2/PF13903_6/1e03Claudin_2/PF13903_6/0_52MHYT/PF03707_16/2_1MHYT/PF03707_16/1_2e03_NODE_901_length_6140_cov_65_133707_g631_i03751253
MVRGAMLTPTSGALGIAILCVTMALVLLSKMSHDLFMNREDMNMILKNAVMPPRVSDIDRNDISELPLAAQLPSNERLGKALSREKKHYRQGNAFSNYKQSEAHESEEQLFTLPSLTRGKRVIPVDGDADVMALEEPEGDDWEDRLVNWEIRNLTEGNKPVLHQSFRLVALGAAALGFLCLAAAILVARSLDHALLSHSLLVAGFLSLKPLVFYHFATQTNRKVLYRLHNPGHSSSELHYGFYTPYSRVDSTAFMKQRREPVASLQTPDINMAVSKFDFKGCFAEMNSRKKK